MFITHMIYFQSVTFILISFAISTGDVDGLSKDETSIV